MTVVLKAIILHKNNKQLLKLSAFLVGTETWFTKDIFQIPPHMVLRVLPTENITGTVQTNLLSGK